MIVCLCYEWRIYIDIRTYYYYHYCCRYLYYID